MLTMAMLTMAIPHDMHMQLGLLRSAGILTVAMLTMAMLTMALLAVATLHDAHVHAHVVTCMHMHM